MSLQPKDVINKLIAADDLHWDEYEKKYIALSHDDINDLILKAYDNGFEEEKDIIKILNWATSVRIGNILLKNFLEGKLSIEDFDSHDEPYFSPAINGNC